MQAPGFTLVFVISGPQRVFNYSSRTIWMHAHFLGTCDVHIWVRVICIVYFAKRLIHLQPEVTFHYEVQAKTLTRIHINPTWWDLVLWILMGVCIEWWLTQDTSQIKLDKYGTFVQSYLKKITKFKINAFHFCAINHPLSRYTGICDNHDVFSLKYW